MNFKRFLSKPWSFTAQKMGVLVLSLLMLFSFQNCNQQGFHVQDSLLESSALNSQTGLALGTLTFQSPESQFPTQSSLMLKGVCSDGVNVEISGDVTMAQTIMCSNGQFSSMIQLAGTDGTKNVILTQTDHLGNKKVDSRNFIKDTQAPLVQFSSGVMENMLVGKTLSLSGICENGIPVRIKFATADQSVNCNNGSFSTSLDLSSVADGVLSLRIEQTDFVGLVGFQTRQFNKKTSAPLVKILSPAPMAQVTSPVVISGSCQTGLDVVLGGTGLATALTIPCVSSAFSSNLNLTAGLGTKTIMATQTDSVGNVGSDSRSFQAIAPTLPPLAVTITAPQANMVAKTGVTLQGACVNGFPVVISGSGLSANINATCSSGTYSAAITFSANDGTKLVQVSQTDPSNGNMGLDSRSFVRDSTPPNLSLLNPAANTAYQSTFVMTGNCESGLTVNFSGGVSTASVVCANSLFSANLTLSSGDGNKTITVTSSDAAGNIATVSRILVKDTVAPQLTITSPAANTTVDTQVTVAGTCEAGLNVIAQGAGAKSAVSMICQTAAYSLSVMMTDGDGAKVVDVSQTDLAGNVAKVSRSFTRSTPTPVLSGAQLYANNCSGCHNPLESSTKLGRTASQITTAIQSQQQMNFLTSMLSSTQIQAIADVLNVSTPPPTAVSCTDPNARGLSKRGVRRLTRKEMVDMIANAIPNSFWKFEQQDQVFEFVRDVEEIPNPSKFPEYHTFTFLSEWAGAVDRWVEYVITDPYVGSPIVDGCLYSSSTVTLDCWKKTVTLFGRTFWRRPLQTSEIDLIAGMSAGMSKIDAGRKILSYMLLAPDFLFHFETQGVEDGKRIRITSHDVANRIAFATTGLPPDKTLAQAADANQLSTISQVDSHVRRLLATPAARKKMRAFLNDWLQLSGTFVAPFHHYGEAGISLANSSRPDWTKEEMNSELSDFFYQIVFVQKGTFNDLMTKKVGYPRSWLSVYYENDKEVRITGSVPGAGYGIDPSTITNKDSSTTLASYATPDHPGLLTRVALMTGGTDHTSPIRRGVKVIRRVLCEELPSPDALTIAERNDDFALYDPFKVPNHQIVSRVTAAPVCMTCHQSINSTGFLFEVYDNVGRRRTAEKVFVQDYPPYQTISHPLPGPVSNLFIEDGLPTSFNNIDEYTSAIGKSQKAMACLSKGLLRHFERRKETSLDQCAVNESKNLLSGNQPVFEAIVKSLANEDIFWREGL